jgi:hypothetical protein
MSKEPNRFLWHLLRIKKKRIEQNTRVVERGWAVLLTRITSALLENG